jgi:signal transduction histidine kinase
MPYFLDGIRQSAIKASDIINSLLEFSRPTKSTPEVVGLPKILDAVVRLTLSDYEMKKRYDVINTRFETHYDPAVPVLVCIPSDLEHVLLSLIKNGIHAMHQGGTKNPCITLRTLAQGDYARIEVEDNGPGIPAQVRRHAFDPFFTTRPPGDGTGLGLSIAHAIITDNHKGRIWVDTSYRNGARFVIELPIGVDINEYARPQ